MISKDSLNLDWINRVSSENRKADKILVEKVIRVLLLLEGLAQSGLPFNPEAFFYWYQVYLLGKIAGE